MSTAEIRGRFVWHELMTTDSAGAGAFYPRVAGWKSQPWDKDANYTLWVGNAGPMGGLIGLPDQGNGMASHWMPYIGTADLEGTIAAARNLGARVCKEVTQIPGAGRFAVLADPQGANFAVYAAGEAGEGNMGRPPQVGDFSWHELATTDIGAAFDFYSQLFGWSKGPSHDMGELGLYQLFTHGGRQIGGMYRLNSEISDTPHWLCYVRVSDVGRAANAAKAAGGRIVNGPMEVPGGDWIAQIIDPQGAAFAVHEVKPLASAQPAPKSTPKPLTAQKESVSTARPRAAAKKTRPQAAVRAKATGKVKRAAPKKAAAKKKTAASSRRGPAKKKASATSVRRVMRKRVAKKRVTRRVRARKRR